MAGPLYLLIDNRARSPGSAPFEYDVAFGNEGPGAIGFSTLSNVKSVEIKHVIMARPQTTNYVIFDIEELNGHLISLDNSTTGLFGVGAFDHATCWDKDSVRVLKGDLINPSKIAFDPPLARLNKLRIRIVKFGGVVLTQEDFMNKDNLLIPGWDEHSIVFEIKLA